MSQSTIETLPVELLTKIFSHVSEDEGEGSPKLSIKAARLVSHKFNQIGSSFLFDRVTVHMTSTSLTSLEEICQHPKFSKFVTHVDIDLAYYDIRLAQNLESFGWRVTHLLCDILRTRHGRVSPNRNKDPEVYSTRIKQLWSILATSSLDRLDRVDPERCRPYKKNLINIHKEYVKLCADQGDVRLGNKHVDRIVAALKNLPRLHSMRLCDDFNSTYSKTLRYVLSGEITLEHPDFFISALVPGRWSKKKNPPIEMLADLLSRLGDTGIRPQHFTLQVAVPQDLMILRPSELQSAGIQRLVSKCSTIDLSFENWTCRHTRGPYNENNDISRYEVLSLGSLATALTSTSMLQQLAFKFNGYPCFHQDSIVSLSDLLPIRSRLWPQLSSINLSHVSCDLEDFAALVDAHRQTLKSFTLRFWYLRTGEWYEMLDVLRGLKSLEHFQFGNPKDGTYNPGIRFPSDEVKAYVLGEAAENPFPPAPSAIMQE